MDTLDILLQTPYNQSARSVLTILIFIKIACVIILIPPIKVNLTMLLFRTYHVLLINKIITINKLITN